MNQIANSTLSASRLPQKLYMTARLGFCVCIVSTLAACASFGGGQGGTIDGAQANFLTEDFPTISANDIAARNNRDVFKVGDTAEIIIYNVEKLSSTYVVDRAGDIVFPHIGRMRVAGLSTLELQNNLTTAYGASFLQNPNISVKLEAAQLGKIVVDGAVEKPGVFEVFDVVQLSEAIALAEGLNEDANGKAVFIVRDIDGERKVRSVDLSAVRKMGAKDPDIIPGDIVFVQDSAGRVLFREFLRTIPLLNTAVIFSTRT